MGGRSMSLAFHAGGSMSVAILVRRWARGRAGVTTTVGQAGRPLDGEAFSIIAARSGPGGRHMGRDRWQREGGSASASRARCAKGEKQKISRTMARARGLAQSPEASLERRANGPAGKELVAITKI